MPRRDAAKPKTAKPKTPKWIAAKRCREEYCRAKTDIIIVILRY